MFKHVLVSFLLSFTAVLMMFFLYVVLPQYLITKYSKTQVFKSGSNSLSLFIPASPSPTPSPTPGLTPVTMIIPKLKLQAAVEEVGLTETSNMDTPKNAANVGWYRHGVKPREIGNAVIAGHYDTPTGKPAIFYNLGKLQKGDEVEIISENAIHSVFVVTEISSIPYDEFPGEQVFKTREGTNLNLITCGGIWDQKKKTYLERIVVYTTLKES